MCIVHAQVRRIHMNFHLGYLKDVVLPRALDDNSFAALNQMQFFNNVQIISNLTNDQPFLVRPRGALSQPGLGLPLLGVHRVSLRLPLQTSSVGRCGARASRRREYG